MDKEINELLVDLPVESSSSSSVEHEEVPRVCELTVDTRSIVELPTTNVDQYIDTSMEIISKREHKSIVKNSCQDEMNLLTFDEPTLQQNSIQFLEPLSPMSREVIYLFFKIRNIIEFFLFFLLLNFINNIIINM